MGFKPDDARCPDWMCQGHRLCHSQAQASPLALRSSSSGTAGQLMDAASRVASSSAVYTQCGCTAARGSEADGGSAKPDDDVAERRCCSEKLDGWHAVVPPVQQHQHDRNAAATRAPYLAAGSMTGPARTISALTISRRRRMQSGPGHG